MKNNVEFLMAKHNIGPTKLANEIKVSRNTIQRLLRGETPSSGTMIKVSSYFNKPIDDIFDVKNVLHVEHNSKKKKSA